MYCKNGTQELALLDSAIIRVKVQSMLAFSIADVPHPVISTSLNVVRSEKPEPDALVAGPSTKTLAFENVVNWSKATMSVFWSSTIGPTVKPGPLNVTP